MDECDACPGQREITLQLLVCSGCDSTIALEEAICASVVGLTGMTWVRSAPAVSWTIKGAATCPASHL